MKFGSSVFNRAISKTKEYDIPKLTETFSVFSDSSCRWLITASNSLSTIDFQVVWSDIETDGNCAYDKLVIYDGNLYIFITNPQTPSNKPAENIYYMFFFL